MKFSSSLFTGILLFFLSSTLVFGQDRATLETNEIASDYQIRYYLYDLSTEAHKTDLSTLFDGMDSVDQYDIDLTTHSVVFETSHPIKEGTQAWIDFTFPIRQALKSKGYVKVNPQDLSRFYQE